jgi:formamidopyrimidine-DNA glycosylase
VHGWFARQSSTFRFSNQQRQMPELPEVETVRRGLEPVMAGRRLVRVEQRRPDLRFPFPDRFVARLEGQRIERLDRRAKYIVVYLQSGDVLTMHLGMSGRFTISQLGGPNARAIGAFEQEHGSDSKHDHVVFHTDGGAVVTYNDARRFGYMDIFAASQLAEHPYFRDIGIEPLGPELTPDFIATAARGKKTDLKAFLMDQRIICGLGNIYVCEALHRAGLSPLKPASRLATKSGKPTEAALRLIEEIKSVLEAAIVAGGSTLRDHQQVDGSLGYFQHRFKAYGRAGETCTANACHGTIERTVQSNRSTFYCRKCQR